MEAQAREAGDLTEVAWTRAWGSPAAVRFEEGAVVVGGGPRWQVQGPGTERGPLPQEGVGPSLGQPGGCLCGNHFSALARLLGSKLVQRCLVTGWLLHKLVLATGEQPGGHKVLPPSVCGGKTCVFAKSWESYPPGSSETSELPSSVPSYSATGRLERKAVMSTQAMFPSV